MCFSLFPKPKDKKNIKVLVPDDNVFITTCIIIVIKFFFFLTKWEEKRYCSLL